MQYPMSGWARGAETMSEAQTKKAQAAYAAPRPTGFITNVSLKTLIKYTMKRTFIFAGPNGEEEVVKALNTSDAWVELKKIIGDTTGWYMNGAQG